MKGSAAAGRHWVESKANYDRSARRTTLLGMRGVSLGGYQIRSYRGARAPSNHIGAYRYLPRDGFGAQRSQSNG